MKYIKFLSCLLASILFLSFASCGSDDDHFENVTSDNEIVGMWSGSNVSIRIEGKNKPLIKKIQKELNESGKNYKATFVFNRDGTCSVTQTVSAVLETDYGTFTTTNGKIHMTDEDGEITTYNVVRRNDTIKISNDETDAVIEELEEMGFDLSVLQISKITMEITLVKIK